ncbi:MAG: hypothetical protein KDA65_14595 [Planctomycetaceae bacterium]|nr:hypothetical protein [Planctomycetaceae bacterium]
MKIFYHDLSFLQFEELVIEICVELLGNGVQGFVPGKDGGRDARFEGKAKCYPNDNSPWHGKIVIQAKHTDKLNASFSESDFWGNDSSKIAQECERIKSLFEAKELEYYMLFANRNLTGVTEPIIRKGISENTGLSSDCIRLFDSSELDRLLKRYPKCLERADLNPAKSPADIDPTDLAEVITKLAEYKQELDEMMEGENPPPEKRVSVEEKNELNNLREEYFKKQIRPKMVSFPEIRNFLGHPQNQAYVNLYETTASELEAKLDAWRDLDTPYERLLETLICRLFNRDFDLRKNKNLTRAVIYYMYCSCDIGNRDNDQT